ncbi:MAG: hypothetical protein JRE40_13180, partial [Deltaproteobacteria bacterium]|nr:hypothetical protein [Deltaproteobacteria bacterium]
MQTKKPQLRLYFLTACALVAATTIVAAEAAKEADAKRPERQMLAKIFAPILKDLGQLNTQKATILSGPTEVKMRRDKQPAKQWVIGLGQAKFKVTIGKKCGKKWTVRDAMKMTEEIPVAYRRCLEIVSEDDKDGLAFYKGLGGAHGSQDYMNVEPGARSRVIIHEGGHCFDQRARNSEPDIMKRWESAIKEDNIDVSGYGNSVSHEDLAEFARIYGYCTDYAVGKGMKWELKKLSPKRFELWEHILRKCKALPLLHLDVEFNPLGGPLHEGKGNTDGAKVEFISGPTKVEWKQYSRSQNKMVTIKGKQWLAKLGDAQFKITFEDVEMQLKREDAVKLVETLPPAYRASLIATSEEGETGLTIYKDGCAYGVPNQIAMGGHNLSATTLAHESGHVIDQKARETDKDIMTKYGVARIRDGVWMSGYGDGPIHEGQAELARLYAISLAHSPESFAKFRSLTPMRCAVWERMLVLTGGMDAKDASPVRNFDFDAELKKNAEIHEKMKPRIIEVREAVKAITNQIARDL